MIGPKATSRDGSTSVGGDNEGSIVNVNAGDGSTIDVRIENEIARKLPSHLGAVIVLFAKQGLASAANTQRRELPPEVIDKIKYNNLPENHRIFRDWARHSIVLERSYHGIEQQNPDARYLVRRKAGAVYEEERLAACSAASVPEDQHCEYARKNAAVLVKAVTDRLLIDYRCSKTGLVEEEVAHLAVSLVVADAVVECEVLEKPDHATAP